MKYLLRLSQTSHCWLQQSLREGILIWSSLLIVVVPLSTARARCSLVEIPDQSSGASKEEPKRTGDFRTLEPGKPIDRDLAAGEVHSYRLVLTSGQYARVVIDQLGINVAVSLFGADGKKIIEEKCTVCHDTDLIVAKHQSKDEWSDTVKIMVASGAMVTDTEMPVLIDYLAKNFGPQ